MKITFLGTGNARGFPVFGLKTVPSQRARANKSYIRRQSAVLLETDEGNLLLDAGRPDLSTFLDSDSLKGICISHYHSDHVLGLYGIKWGKGKKIRVSAPEVETGFGDLLADPGILDFLPVTPFETFTFGTFEITPVPLSHGILTYGYAVQSKNFKLAYLCDTGGLAEETRDFLSNWGADLGIIDCNQAPGKGVPSSHNDLPMVQEIMNAIHLEKAFITHIGEGMQQWLIDNKTLPEGVFEARDGTCIDISEFIC